MKKIVLALCFLVAFALNVGALSADKITPDSDFSIYSAEPEKVADILKTDIDTLKETVDSQNITFLAVNQNKTKQIQLTCTETQFSDTVCDLSNLSDASIKSLLPDIIGLENVKGNIVLKDNQKFVNVNLKNEDEGYILTQYFTVSDKKLFTLSFYTNEGESLDYIETAFSTSEKIEQEIKIEEVPTAFRIAVICGTVIFGLAFLIILFLIIKDLFKTKNGMN